MVAPAEACLRWGHHFRPQQPATAARRDGLGSCLGAWVQHLGSKALRCRLRRSYGGRRAPVEGTFNRKKALRTTGQRPKRPKTRPQRPIRAASAPIRALSAPIRQPAAGPKPSAPSAEYDPAAGPQPSAPSANTRTPAQIKETLTARASSRPFIFGYRLTNGLAVRPQAALGQQKSEISKQQTNKQNNN